MRPNVILNGPDPGVVGDEPEALAGCFVVGCGGEDATIDLVVASARPRRSLRWAWISSALYIVDNNLAPVMSESYGECESVLGERRATRSITRSGSRQRPKELRCWYRPEMRGRRFVTISTRRILRTTALRRADLHRRSYNVSVGGTDFDQSPANFATYWNATNDPDDAGHRRKSYIPETTWNQSCAAQGADGLRAEPRPTSILWAGSCGGPSNCTNDGWSTSNCLGGYKKPAWQAGHRSTSRTEYAICLMSHCLRVRGFNGSFYIICEADFTPFGPLPGYNQPCSLSQSSLSFVGIWEDLGILPGVRRNDGAGEPEDEFAPGQRKLRALQSGCPERGELQFVDPDQRHKLLHLSRCNQGEQCCAVRPEFAQLWRRRSDWRIWGAGGS